MGLSSMHVLRLSPGSRSIKKIKIQKKTVNVNKQSLPHNEDFERSTLVPQRGDISQRENVGMLSDGDKSMLC